MLQQLYKKYSNWQSSFQILKYQFCFIFAIHLVKQLIIRNQHNTQLVHIHLLSLNFSYMFWSMSTLRTIRLVRWRLLHVITHANLFRWLRSLRLFSSLSVTTNVRTLLLKTEYPSKFHSWHLCSSSICVAGQSNTTTLYSRQVCLMWMSAYKLTIFMALCTGQRFCCNTEYVKLL